MEPISAGTKLEQPLGPEDPVTMWRKIRTRDKVKNYDIPVLKVKESPATSQLNIAFAVVSKKKKSEGSGRRAGGASRKRMGGSRAKTKLG